MYANCDVWGGDLGGSENDVFFPVGGIPNRKGQFFFGGGGIRQCNVTYRKNVALLCGWSISAAE